MSFNYQELKEKQTELVSQYCILEGFGSIPVNLNSFVGQNIVRLVGYRVIQELYEADMVRRKYVAMRGEESIKQEFYEELVDAYFFFIELDIITDYGIEANKDVYSAWNKLSQELVEPPSINPENPPEIEDLSLFLDKEWSTVFWNTTKAFCNLLQILRIRPWRPPEKDLDYVEFRARLLHAGHKLIELYSNQPRFLVSLREEYLKKWEINMARANVARKVFDTHPVLSNFANTANVTNLLNNQPITRKEK